MPTRHALLIGIDAYQGGASLNGCVNDIDAIQRILIDKVGVSPERVRRIAAPRLDAVHETDVPARLATLANIRQAFAELTEQVAPGDYVFLYYAGHGTHCRMVADGVTFAQEALLPHDHLVWDEQRFLFDWELNEMIARVTDRTPAVTFILDCCCSAGATRGDFDPPSAASRFWPTPAPVTLTPGQAPPAMTARGVAAGIASKLATCQVIAACHDDERARESGLDGGRSHGELTRALIQVLHEVPAEALAELRWGRIWRAVVAQVSSQNPAQHPWMSGGFARRVFGGPPEDGDAGYGVTRDGGTYTLSAGTLSGVTECARLAVYGSEPAQFPRPGTAEDVAAHAGRLLRVTTTTRSTAEAVAETAPFELPPGARARLVAAGRAARLQVWLSPADPALRDALASSPLLEMAAQEASADLRLVQRGDGGLAIVDDVFGTGEGPAPALVIIPPALRARTTQVVEHYHAYAAPLRLAKTSQDLPHALRLRLLDCNGAAQLSPEQAQHPGQLRELEPGRLAPYEVIAGDPLGGGDQLCIAVHNDSEIDLFITLIACFHSGRVAIVSEAEIPGRAMRAFWNGDVLGRSFRFWLPPAVSVGIDRVIAIGTTNRSASLAHLAVPRSFAEVLEPERYPTRDRSSPRGAPAVEQWTATVTAVRLTRPPGGP